LTSDGDSAIPKDAAARAIMKMIKTRLEERVKKNEISKEKYHALRNVLFRWIYAPSKVKDIDKLKIVCHLTQRPHAERITWSELDATTFTTPGARRVVIYLQRWDDDTRSAEPRTLLEDPPEGVFHLFGTEKGLNGNSVWEQQQERRVADYIIDHVEF
jgi:hypothetical protein